MKDLKELERIASFLSGNIVTIWHDYDYDEITDEIQKRVPKIRFNIKDVDVISEHVTFDDKEKNIGNMYYTREYEIDYKHQTFIFEITAVERDGVVSKFYLGVLVSDGDEYVSVLKESL